MIHILLIEDDFLIAQSIEQLLHIEHMQVNWVNNGIEGLSLLYKDTFDLVLLDLALPSMNGFEVLNKIRLKSSIPIIIISAKDQVQDRLKVLQQGGDDYLVKPFDFNELIARINAVLRRSQGKNLMTSQQLQYKELILDKEQHIATWKHQILDISKKEWGLLEAFLTTPQKIFSKVELEEKLYVYEQNINSNTIEVYIHRLRQKTDKDFIITIRGFGYRLG